MERDHAEYAKHGGFDGFYTYFAADGFTYGSTTRNWNALKRLADDTGTRFIPSVGPGYIDTSVRPWNAMTTRSRDGGRYYDRMWKAAKASASGLPGEQIVSVTSFNEWHEGTQIEPAVPARRGGLGHNKPYQDYGGLGPSGFLKKTKAWSEILSKPAR